MVTLFCQKSLEDYQSNFLNTHVYHQPQCAIEACENKFYILDFIVHVVSILSLSKMCLSLDLVYLRLFKVLTTHTRGAAQLAIHSSRLKQTSSRNEKQTQCNGLLAKQYKYLIRNFCIVSTSIPHDSSFRSRTHLR